ncbi:MAG TPA: PEP/pyruvate-binding domain-containing protein, partial [Blastocatellia bacterium]|nr:PEP/pyruvate-binding domain-containing protein [Blastocatellia bacterium]
CFWILTSDRHTMLGALEEKLHVHRSVRVKGRLLNIVIASCLVCLTGGGYRQALACLSQDSKTRWLGEIRTRDEFDRLARTYQQGRFYALPHVMFVIDRRERGKVYYVNSNLFRFHRDFVNASYLSLERGRAFYENNYLKPDRRFLLGTIAHQISLDRFTFEFWEGDLITTALLGEAYKALDSSFFMKLAFKPNSLAQEEAAASFKKAGAAVITASELARDRQYQPINLGTRIGQLRIIDRITDDTVIDRNQIVVFKESPLQLTPLSGIITTAPASPLSHANLLAKSWAIPNAYIKDADSLLRHLEGRYVRFEAREDRYIIEPADARDALARQREWVKRADSVTPRADLDYAAITDLKDQRARDAQRFGAKSANLGEIHAARMPGIVVPRGFTVPFYYYQQFVRINRLEERIADTVEEDRFVHDPRYRKERLAEIRRWIQEGKHAPAFERAVIGRVRRQYAGKGLFVRSSTNAEDLKDFSGAGLYTTVANVRGDRELMEAVKTVWASVWNFEAYEARESFGMNHFGVYPAVLIQEGVAADSAGVAITTDPFDQENTGAVYINAKRGLGIRVVEGRRVAEQIIYSPRSNTVRVLTRSDEDTMLTFDERGGVKEVGIEPERAVLTDEMVRRLAAASLRIRRHFRGQDQDIEWLFKGGVLFIVQSRPYIRNQNSETER